MVFAVHYRVFATPDHFIWGLARGMHFSSPASDRPSRREGQPDGDSQFLRVSVRGLVVAVLVSNKEFVMHLSRLEVSASGTGVVEVHRSLTRTDLLFCLLPVAAFLSIVSLV
jgi:hypothetical protein